MRSSTRSKALALLLVVGGLSGCADYLNRRDTVSVRAGDAVEGNSAIHIINPAPPGAYDRIAD